MHILIYIFRMMGRIALGRQLKLNHETKSMDELAQTDTLIMDDFFFSSSTNDPSTPRISRLPSTEMPP
jgi:hypothetical protein